MGEVHFKHSGPVSVPLYGASLPDDLKKIEEELAKRAGDNSAKESFVRYVKDFIAAHHIKNSADLKRALPELLNPAGAADIYSKYLGLMESDLFDLCSAIDPKVSAAAIPQISDSDMSNAVFYWIGENAKESPFDPSDNPFAPPDAPKSMRVEYQIGWQTTRSEWVCFEHGGYAGAKAALWWRQRSNEPVPATAAEAVALAEDGALAETRSITVRSAAGEKYDQIVGHTLGPKPAARSEPLPEYVPLDDGECPF